MPARPRTTSGAPGHGSSTGGSRHELIGEHTAFTSDSRLMALCIDRQVSLADAATGRELARLSTVQPVAPTPLSFSPDGTKLVVSTDRNTAHVWDLRRVRDQLATMGLDWDAPAYSAANEHDGPPPPRAVRVVGEVRENQARRAGELAEMDRRLAADPNDADALIHRGWLRLNLSKPAEAVADLERGVRLRPDDTDALFLLSQAYSQSNNLEGGAGGPGDLPDTMPRRHGCPRQERPVGAPASAGSRRRRTNSPGSSKPIPAGMQVRARRAEILLRLRRFAEALADLNTLIKRYPERSGSLRTSQSGP